MSETKAPRPRNVLIAEFEGLSKEDASQALRDAGGDLDRARALVRRRRERPDDTDDDEPAVKAEEPAPPPPPSDEDEEESDDDDDDDDYDFDEWRNNPYGKKPKAKKSKKAMVKGLLNKISPSKKVKQTV